ncbi:MAG TPA: hypothetical protein VK524_04990 [Polyangiaceae bacterium]|nr:hypothetical protein [Polyangiaceae bacterium]
MFLTDVPLTLALLALTRVLRLPVRVRSVFVGLGRWSWGLYLGHALVHELSYAAGLPPEGRSQLARAVYFLFLFVSGSALAGAAAWLEQRATRALGELRKKREPPTAAS